MPNYFSAGHTLSGVTAGCQAMLPTTRCKWAILQKCQKIISLINNRLLHSNSATFAATLFLQLAKVKKGLKFKANQTYCIFIQTSSTEAELSWNAGGKTQDYITMERRNEMVWYGPLTVANVSRIKLPLFHTCHLWPQWLLFSKSIALIQKKECSVANMACAT